MTYDSKDLNSLDFYPAMYGFKSSYSTRFSTDFNDTSESIYRGLGVQFAPEGDKDK